MKSVNDPRYMRFLEKLKAARADAALSQEDLARRLEKHQTYVSKIERGERMLDLMEFMHWAQCLGASPLDLLQDLAREVGGRRRRARLPFL